MSRSANVVVLGGNLTRDPEVRFSQSGVAVVTGGSAGARQSKKGDEWVDEPVFVDYVMFGKRAEAFARHHAKGSPALFDRAELKFESWDDKQTGARRSALKLHVESWVFVGSRRQDGDQKPAGDNAPPVEESPF